MYTCRRPVQVVSYQSWVSSSAEAIDIYCMMRGLAPEGRIFGLPRVSKRRCGEWSEWRVFDVGDGVREGYTRIRS